MAAKSKASMQLLEEEKKKLSEDLISFIRKRSDTDAPMYTAKLRTVVNLQRKRRKASAAAIRHNAPCHAHRFHYAKKKISNDELVDTHADQAESVDRSRSRSRSASMAISNDLDEKCARHKKKKRKCKKKSRSCSRHRGKKHRKRSCHKKQKRSCSAKRKRCGKKKKACHRHKRRRC